MRHLLSLFDLTSDEVQQILKLSGQLKQQSQEGIREPLLARRVLALLFEKPSLRTRVSFESGISRLGGSSLFLGEDVGWGSRETIEDFSRVLTQYVDLVVCRAKSHERVVELAAHAACPVINGLTDLAHPCQALADLLTFGEIAGDLSGKKLAFIGDANNVARSLAIACGKLGVKFALGAPAAYQFDSGFLQQLQDQVPGAEVLQTEDPREAVDQAECVYTDVWASMGQEAEQEERRLAFADYQVNAALMKQAADACFLHCLPARRGEEVTDEVLDGPQSAVIQQAANRMYAQNGLMVWLLGKEPH